MRIFSCFLLLATAALLFGCPSPDSQKKVQEAAKVPGLEEAVIAKDRSLQAAIEMSWKADVELLQEQLAVEEVHAGKVRITGIVSREKLKERAEAIARDQEGVVDVISTITVDESLKDKRISLDDM
ncbi:MAG: BON domain-containing protein [Planctomycetales bacterium]|nr:BON domain-containing protein [bacterium]UNM09464.1 MAG: BON domain-containing protein [Planctomycetales bacterium]